jgi:hypothetical protein
VIATAIVAVLVAGIVTPPAAGQTLAERIAAVRKQRAQEQARREAEVDPRRVILQKLLFQKITIRFEGTPARDVLDYLRTTLDVNMIVRYHDDQVGHGLDPDAKINLVADRMRAVDVLNLVIEQLAAIEPATWQLRESFLEVGTKERLSAPAARVLRTYPVDDLLYEPPRFDDSPPIGMVFSDGGWGGWNGYGGYGGGGYGGSFGAGGMGGTISVSPGSGGGVSYDQDTQARAESLIDLILDTIEPLAWLQNGGSWASIAYRDGALVVYAPDFIHRQLVGYPRVPRP